MICISIEPVGDGNFAKRKDNITSCNFKLVHPYRPVSLLLYLSDVAKCVRVEKCRFGEPNGVTYLATSNNDYFGCISRQYILDRHPDYYVDIFLHAAKSVNCPSPAILIEGRICACPKDMYFDGYDDDKIKCLPLPTFFDESRLKVDITYTYNGK